MAGPYKGIHRLLAGILAVGLLLICALTASAAGPGYSDIIRIYSISGVERNANVSAMAYMFGDAANMPRDNYVVLTKYRLSDGVGYIDVLNGEEFNALLQNSISSSQVEVANLNEYLLSQGAPNDFLILEEKPAVVSELEKALAAGQTSLVAKDCFVVLPDALKYAAQKGGSGFQMHFDSMLNGSVDVRITVTASKATKGFGTYANTLDSENNPSTAAVKQYYSNKVVNIDFVQQGSFGTTVQVAAKVNLEGLDTSSLVFYSYDLLTNKFTPVQNANYTIDSAGYLHFSTDLGGTILITDRPLTKK